MTRTLSLAWQRLHSALIWIVLSPVVLYRRVLSPLKRTPSCRFLPTCSEFAIDVVRERGVVIGSVLAAWRVMRCNPLFRGGYDPVPHRHARCDQEQH